MAAPVRSQVRPGPRPRPCHHGDAAAIDAYLGQGQAFDAAMVAFASAYGVQNQRDYTQLVEAVRDGEIDSAPGW